MFRISERRNDSLRIDAFQEAKIVGERRMHVPTLEDGAAGIDQLAAGTAGGKVAGEYDLRLLRILPALDQRTGNTGIPRAAVRYHDALRLRVLTDRPGLCDERLQRWNDLGPSGLARSLRQHLGDGANGIVDRNIKTRLLQKDRNVRRPPVRWHGEQRGTFRSEGRNDGALRIQACFGIAI